MASKAESEESLPVPCSARPTSLPITEALRTVLTTWKISLNDMWFSLAEWVWFHNVGDRQVLRDVFRNLLEDQLTVEGSYDHRVTLAAQPCQFFLDLFCLIRFLCLQLLLLQFPL